MNISFQRNKDNLFPLTFNNKILDEVKSHKHLGLTLTDNLSWGMHINILIDKVSSMADVLKKLKYQIDRSSLETIYFTFIRPKLEYACHVWDNCNSKDKDLLEKFQHDIARTVCGARKGTSHNAIDEELGWETLDSRRLHVKDKQFTKITTGSAPTYLCDLLPNTVGSSSQRNLRNSNHLKSVKCRTETYRKSFIPSSVTRYNDRMKVDSITDNVLEPVNINRNLYNLGNRSTAIKHAQLRMCCSRLNSHLYHLHVLDSPSCQCGFNFEDESHYLLKCPLYILERNELLLNLQSIGINNIGLDLLLKGSNQYDIKQNEDIFHSIHKYIEDTNRL